MSHPQLRYAPKDDLILIDGPITIWRAETEWKPIPGYEGLYEISNTGYYRGRDLKVKKFVKNNHGYMRAELYKKGVRKRFMIHRLVARVFVTVPRGYTKLEVNHKDGDKSNNNWWNLEYLSKSDNNSHRHHELGKNNFNSIKYQEITEESFDGSNVSWLDLEPVDAM